MVPKNTTGPAGGSIGSFQVVMGCFQPFFIHFEPNFNQKSTNLDFSEWLNIPFMSNIPNRGKIVKRGNAFKRRPSYQTISCNQPYFGRKRLKSGRRWVKSKILNCDNGDTFIHISPRASTANS